LLGPIVKVLVALHGLLLSRIPPDPIIKLAEEGRARSVLLLVHFMIPPFPIVTIRVFKNELELTNRPSVPPVPSPIVSESKLFEMLEESVIEFPFRI
jgi:hypothetical protein